MSERRGEHRGERWVTVAEAAELLGISKDAVRMRAGRATLRSKNVEGRRYVRVAVNQGVAQNADHPGVSNELVTELRGRVRYIEGQLEAERQAHSEARRLLMAALERIPPQLEAPRETETVEEASEGAEPHPDAPGAQEDAQRRSWWRRIFGS